MKKFLAIISLLALPLTYALADGQVVGGKAQPDETLQERAIDPGDNFPFAAGDTIVISKTQTHYLTGEKIANWVYYVMHVIKQVGGKRFPDGILVEGIYSWVKPYEGELLLMGAVERADSAQNAAVRERLQRDKVFIDQRREEVGQLDDVTKQVVDTLSKLTGTKKLEELDADEQLSEEDAQKQALAHQDVEEAFIKRLSEEAVRRADSVAQENARQEAERVRAFRNGKQHRFTIGLRGGVASLMQETENNVMDGWKAGFDGLLDLQYAYYFGAKEGKSCNMGIITGLSVGYSRSPIRNGVDTAYTVEDDEKQSIDYTISAGKVEEHDGQLQLEVPILFSLRHESGVFMNVGPKLMVPLYSHYKQTISEDACIDAYFSNYGVHVSNELVTGQLQEQQYTTRGNWQRSKINVMLTAELGYEWALKNGNALGIGAYANYSLYDLYSNTTDNKSLINVGLPQAGGAPVDVLSATDTYATGLGFFDCGLKVAYHFCFPSKK